MLVPCFNEEQTLAQTVESLLALDYPKDKLEIIIVDDGSLDRTRAIGEDSHAQTRGYNSSTKRTAANIPRSTSGIKKSKRRAGRMP